MECSLHAKREDSEMQGKNLAHNQSAMGRAMTPLDRYPRQEGASTTCLRLPILAEASWNFLI